MKSSYTVPIAIVLGGIIVAMAVYISMPKTPGISGGNPSLVRPVSASVYIVGNPAAKIMIVEYSDFDCEFCKDFHETLHQIIANASVSGNVAWVFRQFPLFEIHPNARAHTRASECAATVMGNDAFWKFSIALFKNQPVDPAQYGTIAASVGISNDAFAICYATASTTLDARINADRQNALNIGA